MALLSNATVNENTERSKDVVGGGDFSPVPTGVYDGVVKMAYVLQPASGSMGLRIEIGLPGDKTITSDEYFQSSNDKGNKTTYSREVDGEITEFPLPGFKICDDLCLLTTGKNLNEMKEQEITVEAWDKEAQARTNQQVIALPEVLGKSIKLAIVHEIQNKTKFVGGKYVPYNEKREFNSISCLFQEDKRTVNEVIDGVTSPVHHDAWLKKHEGVAKDNYKTIDGAASSGEQETATTAGKQQVSSMFKKTE